jgi:outer membrane protein assembly factor BamB
LLALLASPAAANDWPCFLGPNRNGISPETGLNVDWQKKKPKILFKVPIGKGFSSMAVVKGKIYTMAERNKRQFAVCLDADTGKELWSRDLAPGYLDFQKQGPGPRATPTYHDGKLYCLFPLGHFYCLNAADGATVWQAHALKDTGAEDRSPERYFWGLSGSPLVVGEHVIVHPGGSKGNSVAAYHKDTGKLVWKVGDDPPGYGTPVLIEASGVRLVLVTTGESILAVDPVRGSLLWRFPFGMKPYNCNCATPLWVDNVLYLSSAYNAGCAALELGDGAQPKVKWQNKNMQNQVATSVIHDGHMYGTNGTLSGYTLRCIDLKTGTIKWSDRGPEKSSFVAAQGHLFCLSSSGNLRVVECNPQRYVLKGELNNLLTPNTWAAPALVNRRLYARDEKNLVCVDLTP